MGSEFSAMGAPMGAEARLASFLVNLSARFARRGYSPSDFVLRMTRGENGLLDVQQKRVLILDPKGLRRLLAVP